MNVNLEMLSVELTAAGISAYRAEVDGHDSVGGNALGFSLRHNGKIYFFHTWIDQPALDCLDIIRRHVAPVAPDPGLREAIRDAIFNSLTITYDTKTDCDLVSCDTELSADAVLAVLAERGVR